MTIGRLAAGDAHHKTCRGGPQGDSRNLALNFSGDLWNKNKTSLSAQRLIAIAMIRRRTSFYEIEGYCNAHHFTIFHGALDEEGLPQAAWNREEIHDGNTF